MIYGCSGCKFRSTALEEVKAHHAVAHKDRGGVGASTRRGKRAKQQPAKPLEVILIDSDDDDDDDDDESGSDTDDDDSGDESDDSFGGGAGSSDAEVTTSADKATKGAEHASNWLSSFLWDYVYISVLRTSV